MKRFLQWFVTLLQILFGLAFIAVIGLFIFGRFDINRLKDDTYLKYIAYGCAGLYAALSLVVMAVVLSRRKNRFFAVSEGGGITARVPASKIKKLLQKASDSVKGVGLKKFLAEASSAGYTLKLKISVAGRSVKEASDELKGVISKLCLEVYGLVFADVEIIVVKIVNEADAEGAVKEVRAEMETSAVIAAEPEYNIPYYSEPEPVYAPPPEPQPEPAAYVYEPAPSEPAATVYTPEPEPKAEPIIKTATAAKPAAPKTAAKAPAKTSSAAKAAPKTAAAKAPAKTTAKQKIDPNDPPPFKL